MAMIRARYDDDTAQESCEEFEMTRFKPDSG